MDDPSDVLKKLSNDFLRSLHEQASQVSGLAPLGPRMEAVAAIELAKRVPYEVRVHILSTITYVIVQHEGVKPEEAADLLANYRSLFLPEKTAGWAQALVNDEAVRSALEAGDRNYEKTADAVESNRQRERKNMS